MIDTQKLREALDLIEYELQASYNNAKPVCCGHGYGECCGNPEPGWDAGDQKIMDVLGPIQRMLSDAVSQADAQAAEIAEAKGQIDRYRRSSDRWQRAAESAGNRAQAAANETERLREALNEAVRVLESARLLCNWPSMNEAIDAAARAGRAALAQEQGGSVDD